jgi:hypothetical protein
MATNRQSYPPLLSIHQFPFQAAVSLNADAKYAYCTGQPFCPNPKGGFGFPVAPLFPVYSIPLFLCAYKDTQRVQSHPLTRRAYLPNPPFLTAVDNLQNNQGWCRH